jgi:hypothetical protein
LEDRVAALRGAVEIPIRALYQSAVRAVRSLIEAVQRSQVASWRHFEDRASVEASAKIRGPVEIAVIGQRQSCQRSDAIQAGKAMQRDQRACRSDFEDCSASSETLIVPAIDRCPVKIAIGGLHERSIGNEAIGLVKTVQRGQHSGRSDLENCPFFVGATEVGRPVEVTVRGLHQRTCRIVSVSAVRLGAKVIKRGQDAGRRDLENRSAADIAVEVAGGSAHGPTRVSCAVEVAIGG